jgi:hypothetical protein
MNFFCLSSSSLRGRHWAWIFEPEAMQQRDQSRAAFVNEAEFLRDEGTDFRAERGPEQCTSTTNNTPATLSRAFASDVLIRRTLPANCVRRSPFVPGQKLCPANVNARGG